MDHGTRQRYQSHPKLLPTIPLSSGGKYILRDIFSLDVDEFACLEVEDLTKLYRPRGDLYKNHNEPHYPIK